MICMSHLEIIGVYASGALFGVVIGILIMDTLDYIKHRRD